MVVKAGPSQPGPPYVEVTFADDGMGIPPEVLPKIYDPFFTTKGNGTGLGLAVVHGIIKDHGGSISVEGQPGQGTTFTLRFPVSVSGALDGAEGLEILKFGSGETNLLVDDEPGVLETTGALLEFLGYSVGFLP